MAKSIGQIEAEMTKAIVQFEKEYLGRGPRDARTHIIGDMIIIRLKGLLTPAEQKLANEKDGRTLVKEVRRQLFESSRPLIEEMVENITDASLISLHTDISSKTGERIILLVTDQKLDEKYQRAEV